MTFFLRKKSALFKTRACLGANYVPLNQWDSKSLRLRPLGVHVSQTSLVHWLLSSATPERVSVICMCPNWGRLLFYADDVIIHQCLFMKELKSCSLSRSPHIQKWNSFVRRFEWRKTCLFILCVRVRLGETMWLLDLKLLFVVQTGRALSLVQLRPGFCSKCFCQSGFFLFFFVIALI